MKLLETMHRGHSWAARVLLATTILASIAAGQRVPSAPLHEPRPARLHLSAPAWGWGFAAPWDARSDTSIRAHSAQLEAVVSGWIRIDSVTNRAALAYPDTVTVAPATQRMAIVSTGQGDHFHATSIRRLAADPKLLTATTNDIAALVAAHQYAGLVLDFEEQTAADLPALTLVVSAIANAAHAAGARSIAVAIPALDTLAYPTAAFFPAADYVLVMLYDQHWSTSSPGPIATPDWLANALARRVAAVGPNKIVAALPAYGYQWRNGKPTLDIGYLDARKAAAAAHVPLARDSLSQTLHAAQAGKWDLWVSDAGLLTALRNATLSLGVQRTALWRLGLEDPAIWQSP